MDEFVPVTSTKTNRDSGDIAPLIIKLALDGGESTWVPKLCSRVLFDKLTVMQVVKKLSAF
jgi:hypothetical protein